jgi:HlyD family secretion protein
VVRLEKPIHSSLVEFINAPGEVEPKKNVGISAKVSARIVELPYEEGDRVTKGDPEADPPQPASVLVRLDDSDLKASLRSVQARRDAQAAQIEVEKVRIEAQKANVKAMEISLQQAQRELTRQSSLIQSQDTSRSVFEDTQCQVDEKEARLLNAQEQLKAAEMQLIVMNHNLEAADAEIARAEENLSYTTISSPIDGVITRINAEEGEVVMTGTMNNPGTIIMTVADLSQMLLMAEVDESDIGYVKVGQQARVHIQAYADKEFHGVVDTIALTHNRSNTGSKYFETEILLDTEDYKVLSGLTADVDIEVARHEDVLIVPSQAVMGRKADELPLKIREDNPLVDPNKTYATVVYCYDEGKAKVTPVKIGPNNSIQTVILEGLSDEDQVVVGPYKELEKLKHDQQIKAEREVEKEKEKSTDPNKTASGEPNETSGADPNTDPNDSSK